MSAYFSYLNNNINKNNRELSRFAGSIKWVNSVQAIIFEEERNQLLNDVKSSVNFLCNQTKASYGNLSKGCELCCQGSWSCLFINNVCNANCFFCPSQQDLSDELPSSQLKIFETPDVFADYVRYFGFKGVSISGGEPLLNFKKSLSYIEKIREKCADDIYFWLYTNGLKGTKQHYQTLNRAGINEIRMNLCASNYNLDLIERAHPHIQNLTVEIPAIPEDYKKVIAILPQLVSAGVKHLNLHTLRPTSYNAGKLISKNYTFAHGDGITVIESEITALKILNFAVKHNLDIGINYCSFHYKYNFQKSGYRKILAKKLILKHQEVTSKGYLRSIKIKKGGKDQFITLAELQKKFNKNVDISLQYEGVQLLNYQPDSKLDPLIINGKPYLIQRYIKTREIKMPARLYLKILEIGSARNLQMEDSFQVFQMENFEEELPSYY